MLKYGGGILGFKFRAMPSAPSLFLGYFLVRVSFLFWPALDHDLSNSAFLIAGIIKHVPPCLPYLLRNNLANFLPRLASNHDPPDICFLSNWDYRCEPLCPA
jgi:hypothetical protein